MRFLVAAASAALVVLTACHSVDKGLGAADYAFTNGRVYTLDEGQLWADTVLVRGDSVIYVGDAAGAAGQITSSTKSIDLGGQMLLPGFIDSHSHFLEGALIADALFLDGGGEPRKRILAALPLPSSTGFCRCGAHLRSPREPPCEPSPSLSLQSHPPTTLWVAGDLTSIWAQLVKTDG